MTNTCQPASKPTAKNGSVSPSLQGRGRGLGLKTVMQQKLPIKSLDIFSNSTIIVYIEHNCYSFFETNNCCIQERSPLMPDTPTASSPPRRLRGAPLNNLNALKHGFYARKFRQTDLVDLAESKFQGLNEEITMLRVFMRRVIEQSSSASSLSENIEVLRILSLAAASLTRMARTQKYLDTGSGGFWLPAELFTSALEDVRKEYEKKGEKI
jgi:hypothetical protein